MERVHARWAASLLLVCLAILGFGTMEGSEAGPPEDEFLFYRNEGAPSPSVEVRILTDGSGTAAFRRHPDQGRRMSFRLNAGELQAVMTLVRAADFFSLPDDDTEAVTHAGTSTLRISMGGSRRDLSYVYRSALNPLTEFLRKIVQQGVLLADLSEKGDAYSTLTALSPWSSGPEVLQPEVFAQPLMELVRRTGDDRTRLLAIEGLSWVTTPEQWMGFLAGELERSDHARRLSILKALVSHPFTGNLSKTHLRILSPLFLDHLRHVPEDFKGLPHEERLVYSSLMSFLGDRRYTPAIPRLISLAEAVATKGDSWPIRPLAMMRGDAIGPLEDILSSPNPDVRGTAVETLRDILGYRAQAETLSVREKTEILRRLRTSTAPRLEALMARDPDGRVRDAAKRALEQIETGWIIP